MRIRDLMASVVVVFLSSAPAIASPGLIVAGEGSDSVQFWDPTGNAPPPIIITAEPIPRVIDNQ